MSNEVLNKLNLMERALNEMGNEELQKRLKSVKFDDKHIKLYAHIEKFVLESGDTKEGTEKSE